MQSFNNRRGYRFSVSSSKINYLFYYIVITFLLIGSMVKDLNSCCNNNNAFFNVGGLIGVNADTDPTPVPTPVPTPEPTPEPTRRPTRKPTRKPTRRPTKRPTRKPTRVPTKRPTRRPTREPSRRPTNSPTKNPTKRPTSSPTKRPTNSPTKNPTKRPTNAPTRRPTNSPTKNPTKRPTRTPTHTPTARPTHTPTRSPTKRPTGSPTHKPTRTPTRNPTKRPSRSPTRTPTRTPTKRPTRAPSRSPSARPTFKATPKATSVAANNNRDNLVTTAPPSISSVPSSPPTIATPQSLATFDVALHDSDTPRNSSEVLNEIRDLAAQQFGMDIDVGPIDGPIDTRRSLFLPVEGRSLQTTSTCNIEVLAEEANCEFDVSKAACSNDACMSFVAKVREPQGDSAENCEVNSMMNNMMAMMTQGAFMTDIFCEVGANANVQYAESSSQSDSPTAAPFAIELMLVANAQTEMSVINEQVEATAAQVLWGNNPAAAQTPTVLSASIARDDGDGNDEIILRRLGRNRRPRRTRGEIVDHDDNNNPSFYHRDNNQRRRVLKKNKNADPPPVVEDEIPEVDPEAVDDKIQDIKDEVKDKVMDRLPVDEIKDKVKDQVMGDNDETVIVDKGNSVAAGGTPAAFVPGTAAFSPDEVRIRASSVLEACSIQYGTDIPVGSACISSQVSFDVIGSDYTSADLKTLGTSVASTVATGVFENELAKKGSSIVVQLPPEAAITTAAPSMVPSSPPTIATPQSLATFDVALHDSDTPRNSSEVLNEIRDLAAQQFGMDIDVGPIDGPIDTRRSLFLPVEGRSLQTPSTCNIEVLAEEANCEFDVSKDACSNDACMSFVAKVREPQGDSAENCEVNSMMNNMMAMMTQGAFMTDIFCEVGANANVQYAGSSSPSDSPTAPTVEPTTLEPTVEPTKYIDPCPRFGGDCAGCLQNPECLWCVTDMNCFNQDTSASKRSLQMRCDGTITGSNLVCDMPSPSLPKQFVQTQSPTAEPKTEQPSVSPTLAPSNNTNATTNATADALESSSPSLIMKMKTILLAAACTTVVTMTTMFC